MQNIRSKANLDKWVQRPSRYGALDFFIQDTKSDNSIISDELFNKAKTSIGSTLQTAVLDYDASISISNTRSVTIADSENTSQMVNFTFITYSWGFTQVPSMFTNNEIGAVKDWNRKFLKYLHKFAATLDSACVSKLSTEKNQVFGDILDYTNQSNVVVAPFSEIERILGDVEPMMDANDFYGDIHMIGNTGFKSLVNRLKEKAKFNEQDKTIQLMDKTLHYSNRVTNHEDHRATMFAVMAGSCGLLFRFERDAVRGTKSKTSHEWDIETLPLINIPVGTYYYEGVGDYNTIAGAATADLTRTWKQHFGFSVDVCYVTVYNQDLTTYSNPIMQLAVARNG
jgi:hypothetical protein